MNIKGLVEVRVKMTSDYFSLIINFHLSPSPQLLIISINLLVVYRESLNLIGYITRRLSADSLQL